MRRGIIFLVTFLILLGVATAAEGITIEDVASKSNVEPGQEAIFNLSITNIGAKEQQIQLQGDSFVSLPSSNFEYLFVEPSYVELKGHKSVDVTVRVLPKLKLKPGKRYKTFFTVKSLDEGNIDETYNLEMFLLQPTEPVSMEVTSIPQAIVPGNSLPVKLTIKNNIDEDLNNVDIFLTSDLFEEKKTVQLFVDQEREVEFLIPIPTESAPKDYVFSGRLYYNEELSSTISGTFSVSLNSDVTTATKKVEGFLFTETTVTKTNKGNQIVPESYTYDVPLIQGMFTGYSVDASSKVQGDKIWNFNLAPAEDYQIVIKVDYRPLIVGIIVLILLAIVLYYFFTNRVSVKKEVFKLKYSTDGLSEFKVLLHVKNNTSKPITDVKVVDRLPKVIQPQTSFGTLHPTGVERGDKGIRMMWKIDKLLNGEERIISYQVTTGMKVIGNLNLPKTLVKYKNASKRINRTSSNTPTVYSGVVQRKVQKTRKPKKESL